MNEEIILRVMDFIEKTKAQLSYLETLLLEMKQSELNQDDSIPPSKENSNDRYN